MCVYICLWVSFFWQIWHTYSFFHILWCIHIHIYVVCVCIHLFESLFAFSILTYICLFPQFLMHTYKYIYIHIYTVYLCICLWLSLLCQFWHTCVFFHSLRCMHIHIYIVCVYIHLFTSLFFWTNLTNMCLFPQSIMHTYSYIYSLCMYTFVYESLFLDNFDIYIFIFSKSLILGTRKRDTQYNGCTAVDLSVRERKIEKGTLWNSGLQSIWTCMYTVAGLYSWSERHTLKYIGKRQAYVKRDIYI